MGITQTCRSLCLIVIAASLLLSGCAGYSPGKELAGADRDVVIEQMGPPTAETQLESGSRLVYARGPYGRHTYFVDINADGTVQRWEQVLTEENFKRITAGMPKKQVEAIIGPSFIKTTLGRQRGEVWAYRYETPFCIWFEIEFTLEGIVRSAGHGFPPECLRDHTRWMPGRISFSIQ